jgi:hypothetical protein
MRQRCALPWPTHLGSTPLQVGLLDFLEVAGLVWHERKQPLVHQANVGLLLQMSV